ncbi:MAG: tRNA pseudouridine(38-40) synthase TruA [Pseudomonadota bacterium]
MEYDGTPFVGWQMQTNGRSVQGAIDEALAAFAGGHDRPRGAGRTDTGVHALGQVAHVDLDRAWTADKLQAALNAHLRYDPISILRVMEVPETFDARFSAMARHYLYRILIRRAPPALEENRVWWIRHDLDAAAMHEAAQALVGHHDFTTFRAAACQANSPVRTLDRISIERSGEQIALRVSARSFLHHQVRSITGSLKCVGEGRWPVEQMAKILKARDRSLCAALAPAKGLYLARIDYEDADV